MTTAVSSQHITFRRATPEDRDGVVELGRIFYETELARFDMTFDRTQAETDFDFLVCQPSAIGILAIQDGQIIGMIAGVHGRKLFGAESALEEMAWFVHPRHRSCGPRLLNEFERWGRDNGCKTIIMVHLHGTDVNRFYIRRGYRLIQSSYAKEV